MLEDGEEVANDKEDEAAIINLAPLTPLLKETSPTLPLR
jgi:hypothetical protein